MIGSEPPTEGLAKPAEALRAATERVGADPDSVTVEDGSWQGLPQQYLAAGRVRTAVERGAVRAAADPGVREPGAEGRRAAGDRSGRLEGPADGFAAFYQEDMSATRPKGGFGLGLFVASRLCQACEGDLSIHNRNGFTVGRGTRTVRSTSRCRSRPASMVLAETLSRDAVSSLSRSRPRLRSLDAPYEDARRDTGRRGAGPFWGASRCPDPRSAVPGRGRRAACGREHSASSGDDHLRGNSARRDPDHAARLYLALETDPETRSVLSLVRAPVDHRARRRRPPSVGVRRGSTRPYRERGPRRARPGGGALQLGDTHLEVDSQVEANQLLVVLVGPNGAGKSSLLHAVQVTWRVHTNHTHTR